MCKISIIVPVYKVEKYIKRCINSILNQTFKDFELILVDDGSPDKCGEICDEYAKKDRRIIVIHKKNGGLSSARNEGLDIAKGQYIGFVDSDDFINKNMYKVLYETIINNEADIVMSNFKRVYKYDEFNENIENKILYSKLSNVEALEKLYSENNVQLVTPCNKLYKKKLFDDLRYIENRINEDEFMAHKVLYKSSKIIYLDLELYYYFQSEDSIMRNGFSIKRLDAVYALKDRVDFFRKNKLMNLEKIAERYYIEMFFDYYYNAKKNLKNVDNELKDLKSIFDKNLKYFIVNPHYNIKEKLLCIVFTINPNIYERYINRKRLSNDSNIG